MNHPVAIAVVMQDGCILVGQRANGTHLAGMSEFPGGKIQTDESIEAAAIRECAEETGLDVEVLELIETCSHAYDHGVVELHFVRCRVKARSDRPHPPFQWIPIRQLQPGDFPAANQSVLRRLRAACGVSAHQKDNQTNEMHAS